MSTKIYLRSLAAMFLIILCALSASGTVRTGTPDFHAPADCRKEAWVRIEAFATVPLVGADVAIYDHAGRRLYRRTSATNARGVFPARLRVPRDFRVTVTFNGDAQPGSSLQQLGQFALIADVHDYDALRGVVYVNPVTTLVSKVMDRQSWPNLSRAQARVRRLLTLPAGSALGASLRESSGYHSGYFSQSAFAAAALRHGGMNAYLDELALQAMQPRLSPLSFPGLPAEDNPIASFIAQQIAGGAISWADGQGLGWVMRATGISTPGATQAQIAQMQQSLADLQSSVEALSNQLDALNRAVLGKLSKVEYETIAEPALNLSTQVNTVGQNLSFFAQGCPPLTQSSAPMPPSVYCSSEKATLLTALNTVAINTSFNQLASYLLDNQAAGVSGLLHLYSEALGESQPFFRPADSVRLQAMHAFWESAQVQAAEMQVELLHVNDAQNNPGGIAQLYAFLGNVQAQPPTQGTLQTTLAAEKKLIFPALPVGTVISTADHTMWLVTAPVLYGNVPFVFCGVPPTGSIQKSAVTSPLSIQGFNWVSPSVTEAQALVDGWSGSTPNQWLTANTLSTTSPTSSGFGNYLINQPLECNKLDVPPTTVWTRNSDAALDLNTGHIVRVSSKSYNWILLDRQLASGEQYYWYPGQ